MLSESATPVGLWPPGPGGLTRRELLARAAKVGAAAGAFTFMPSSAARGWIPAQASRSPSSTPLLPEPPFGDADYWTFIDWCQSGLEPLWNAKRGTYGDDGRVNAGMLVTHSIAALEGHVGPARQDERARTLAARLVQSPPYRPAGAGGGNGRQRHAPGFVVSLSTLTSDQDVAIDPQIAEGLVFAWRARQTLGLSAATVAAIELEVAAVASAPFFRYPSVRLNQINWPSALYAYAAELAGRSDLLRDDYRRQLSRFLRGCVQTTPPWIIPNLSQSYSFHRNPFAPLHERENIESTEYANIVLGTIAYYRRARAAGMAPLPADQLRTLRAWMARALPAYWTHSGYPNWDTGMYLARWHNGRFWALAFAGLLAIANAPDELRSPEFGSWAKYIFDRALSTYCRLALERGPDSRIPGSPVFNPLPDAYPGYALFADRFQCQAARAIYEGLGHARGTQPPPLYAFDPGIGRLAITTPAYNTAVVAVSNSAFPYGGIELARLFDGDQRVAAGTGPYGAAGFGVTIADANGIVLASQTPHRFAATRPPVVLIHSPRGPIGAGVPFPTDPYAGHFDEIQCTGTTTRGRLSVQTTHTFTADRIRTRWQIRRPSGREPLVATVGFPTWEDDAVIIAELKSGATITLRTDDSTEVPLSSVSGFTLHCGAGQSGYSLKLLQAPSGATAQARQVLAQTSNPRPGPRLVVSVARGGAWRDVVVEAELVPLNAPPIGR